MTDEISRSYTLTGTTLKECWASASAILSDVGETVGFDVVQVAQKNAPLEEWQFTITVRAIRRKLYADKETEEQTGSEATDRAGG